MSPLTTDLTRPSGGADEALVHILWKQSGLCRDVTTDKLRKAPFGENTKDSVLKKRCYDWSCLIPEQKVKASGSRSAVGLG